MKSNGTASIRWRVLVASALSLLLIINGGLAAMKPQTAPSRAKTTEATRASNVASATNPVASGPARMGEAARAQIKDAYAKLPLRFEENRGRADSNVKFISRGPGYSLLLTETEAVLKLAKADARAESTSQMVARSDFNSEMARAMPPLSEKRRASLDRAELKAQEPGPQSAVLRMRLINANPAPVVSGRDELPNRASYYIGSNPKNWSSRARNFEKIEYKDVYRGVDLIYYGNQGQLEYDFNVAPGADPRAITMNFSGADGLTVDSQGSLIIRVGNGEIRQHKPVIYQELFGIRMPISGHYLLKGGSEVGFQVGNYDRKNPLVIDPVVSFGTYLGGSGADSMFGHAVDAAGNVYTAGFTTSLDFPTANASQLAYGGGIADVVVSKLSPDLSQLLFSTYIGGSGDDRAFGLDLDGAGNIYITGYTASPNFPTRNAMQPTFSGIRDIFAVKLDGQGSLVYSTYIGRNGDDRGQALAVDAAGNAAIVGLTSSTTFPMVNAFQPTFGGSPADVFVLKLNAAGSALLYSSYLGGSASAQPIFGELVNGIRLDSAGNIYLTGFTESNNFPTKNTLQSNFGGGTRDVFLAKFDPSRSGTDSLIYSTYLGGSDRDEGNAVTVDSAGNAYVTGFTFSTNFPTASAEQASLAGGADIFVSKLNPSGRALVYSTYLGGSNNEQGTDIEVDGLGRAFVAGGSTSSNFPKAVPIGNTGATANLPPSDCGFGFVLGEIITAADGSISLEVSSSNTGLTDTNVNDLDVSEDGFTIYTAADSGVFKSDDGGLTWARTYQTGQGVTATAILIGASPDEVYVGLSRAGTTAVASVDEVRAANGDGYVLGSTNGGRTFDDLGLNLSVGLSVKDLEEISAESQRRIVALLNDGFVYQRLIGALAPWQQVVRPGNVTHLTVNSSKDTGYAAINNAGTNNGVHRFNGTIFTPTLIINQTIRALGTGREPGDLVAITQTGNDFFTNTSTDFGRSVSQVKITTPSGASEFHGGAFYFHRNNALNATNFFNTTDGMHIVDDRGRSSRTLRGINTAGFHVSGNRAKFISRFGESPIVSYHDASGNIWRAGCIPADGNSNNSRLQGAFADGKVKTMSYNTGATDLLKLIASRSDFGDLISPAATPFQANNRGGFDSVILALDFSPRITSVERSGKHLLVKGTDFTPDAKILVNGEAQKTLPGEDPTTELIGKKLWKRLPPGQTVKIQVEDSDGTRSNEVSYTRE